ncbi:MAG TPA: hypothetical protein VIM64_19505 [Puia sp.]
MRTIFIGALLFFFSNAHAQGYLRNNEMSIFSFHTQGGKYVMLAKDKDDAYIVYRYGTRDSIEFEYPEKNKDSWKKFKYSYYLRGGGAKNEGMDLNYLYFTNNGYKYSIYDTYYAVNNRSAVGISVTNLKTNKTIDIKGAGNTRKGTMTDFRNNNLVEVIESDQ